VEQHTDIEREAARNEEDRDEVAEPERFELALDHLAVRTHREEPDHDTGCEGSKRTSSPSLKAT